jgi:CRISPR-associated endonuclease/helicase Cas3
MTKPYFCYWGKAANDGTYHLLPYHCLDVAAVGSVLLRKDRSLLQKLTETSGVDKQIISNWVVFFLGIHDVGKFSDGFQNLRSDLLLKLQERASTKGYSVRHDSLGFALWEQCLWEVAWQEGG